MRHLTLLLSLFVALLLATPTLADIAPRPQTKRVLEPSLKNQIALDGGTLVLGGTPAPEELAAFARDGFKTVIDLRGPTEPEYAEHKARVEELKMTWIGLPVAGADGVTFANAAAMVELLEQAEGPTILHCASGNRVGALFALAVGAIPGTSVDEAIAYGQARGLTRLEPMVRELLAPKPE